MKTKSGVTVLVVVAVLLAVVAIGLNMTDSSEVTPTTSGEPGSAGPGQADVTILPPTVDDKLNEEESQA